MMTSSLNVKNRQSGVALVTGLIFMVVLTIIVISALRSSTLEERMAANARNRQVALQAAEAVLRDAEVALFAVAAPPFEPFTQSSFPDACNGTYNGLCGLVDKTKPPRWQTVDWDSGAATRTFTDVASNLTGVASQPRYIVEIDKLPIKGASSTCPPVLYRLTARGVGMDNSTVFVQTKVRHLPTLCPEL